MKISYSEDLVGKPEKREMPDGRFAYFVGEKKVNLGYNWKTVDLDFDTIFDVITVAGYATSAELSCANRKDEYFLSRELLMVDIDEGMTIEELLSDQYYNNNAAGFYTTPSHTDDAHRFRILFRLQTPITDSDKLRKLNRALLKVYDQADQSCKDPARLFYGNPNCLIKEKSNNLLSDDEVKILINMIDAFDAEEMTTASNTEYQPLDDAQKKEILELLKNTFVGSYPLWRNVGWGLKQGGFSLQDFQYVTTGMMSEKTPAAAKAVWNDGSSNGSVTMGSVIYLLKSRHGELNLTKKEPPQWQQRNAARNFIL